MDIILVIVGAAALIYSIANSQKARKEAKDAMLAVETVCEASGFTLRHHQDNFWLRSFNPESNAVRMFDFNRLQEQFSKLVDTLGYKFEPEQRQVKVTPAKFAKSKARK